MAIRRVRPCSALTRSRNHVASALPSWWRSYSLKHLARAGLRLLNRDLASFYDFFVLRPFLFKVCFEVTARHAPRYERLFSELLFEICSIDDPGACTLQPRDDLRREAARREQANPEFEL